MSKLPLTIIISLICILYSCSAPVNHQNEEIFKRGVYNLKAGKYQSVIIDFKKLETINCKTANLYNNMGVCSYKTEQFGLAVLYFEKGLLLSPLDQQLINNRTVVLKHLKVEVIKNNTLYRTQKIFLANLFNIVTKIEISIFLIFSIIFLSSSFEALNTWSASLKKLGLFLLPTTIIILIISWVMLYNYQSKKHAIIIRPSIARIGPSSLAKPSIILNEGLQVEIVNFYKDWYKVKDYYNNYGWVNCKEQIAIN